MGSPQTTRCQPECPACLHIPQSARCVLNCRRYSRSGASQGCYTPVHTRRRAYTEVAGFIALPTEPNASVLSLEHNPHAGDRMQQPGGVRTVLKLAPEAVDGDPHHVCPTGIVISPHLFEDGS